MPRVDFYEYMFLVFARERYFEITVSETKSRIVAMDHAAAIERYYTVHVEPDVERAETDWDRSLARFKAQTRKERFEQRRGSMGSRYRVELTRLTFPDGTVEECNPNDADSRIEEAFRRRRGAKPDRWRSRAEWVRAHAEDVEERRGWVATTYQPNGEERPLDVDLSDWRFGAPLAGITATLNEFSTQGWRVCSTSEDKGLYLGTDAQNESYPSRIRILLERPRDLGTPL